jgi:hypothetical protein
MKATPNLSAGYAYSNEKGTIIFYAGAHTVGRSEGMTEQQFYDLIKLAFKNHVTMVCNVHYPDVYIEIGTGNVLIRGWSILPRLELFL